GLYVYACSYVYLQPSLPTSEQMRNVELKVPLRIYTSTGDLIAQIGAQQRTPARNMFLTLDKTFRRKLQETFVTYEMDHEFTKKEIFQLYLNKIFFGQRS